MSSNISKKHRRWLALISEKNESGSGNTEDLETWAAKKCEPDQIYVPGYDRNGKHIPGYCKKR